MTELRVLFENADAAEWALVRLRERGLHPDKYSIRSADRQESEVPQGMLQGTAAALFGMGPALSADAYPAGGNALVPFGGIVNDSISAIEADNREAELRLQVPDRDAKRVEGILINHRGRIV